jgi:hypothetical protein
MAAVLSVLGVLKGVLHGNRTLAFTRTDRDRFNLLRAISAANPW